MEQNKIKEYSVLMAEFMGYKLVDIHSPFLGKVWRKEDLNNSPLYKFFEGNEQDNIYFHKSYDWLFPVWVKFRELMMHKINPIYNILDVKGSIEPYLINDILKMQDIRDRLRKLITDGEIEEAFEALAQAIEWYNTIKK